MMFRQKLAQALEQAVIEARQKGLLVSSTLPEVTVEHPQNIAHGDYASSLPLKLSRATEMPPLAIAESLVELMPSLPEVGKIVVAPPGFINFTLSPEWLTRQVEVILDTGEAYGNINLGNKRQVQVEFVSVNPTGPLHVGHGRGAVLGSTLASVLSAAGYKVETEYYINDAGSQLDAFNRTLYARYQQCLNKDAEIPSDGYHGHYMIDLAKEIAKEQGDRFLIMPEDAALTELGQIGVARIMGSIKRDLALLGVKFDVWFSELSLFSNGQYEKAMRMLCDGNYTSEKENATWFTSSALGEDKDNVLIRSDGSPTYFASDV
ncbi:MAG: arginine--tRNA ligase, partial [Chloroflexi bacterium]|nr:arginine--tRNA ligase [Chloroflexota bacterium]